MNAISYINGDEQITDFPVTSARPLASSVQLCNDLLAGPDGCLSPEDSLVVLDLGWLTVGTADVADDVMHIWVTKLLISPPWGVVRCTDGAAAEAITAIAELHRRLSPGDTPSIADWDSAARAARAVSETSQGAELYAVRAAYQSSALVETDDWDTLDAVTGNALRTQTGKRGSGSSPHPGSHAQRDPLMAAPWRVKRGEQQPNIGCRCPATQSGSGVTSGQPE
jgi:hypothetical protein